MPHSRPRPAEPGATVVTGSGPPPDLKAGPWLAMSSRTGLPLSVWPGMPGLDCPGPASGLPPCPGAGAAPVIAAFSRPGDLVAVPWAGCAVLAAAAARTGRRVLGTAASPGDQPGGASCRPGQAALAVTVFPSGLPTGAAGCEAVLTAACQGALRPGGILAIIVGRPASGQIPDLGHAVACARAAGLVYAQHIVLIHAAVEGGHLRPFPGQHAAATCLREDPSAVRIHTDLLILTKPGGPDDR